MTIGKSIRLERIINRDTGRTIIVPLDHGVTVGPILLGAAKPVHILTPTSTVRRLVNMTALAAVDAAGPRQA